MKKLVPAFFLSLIAVTVVLGFQNCAEPLPKNVIESDASSNGSGGNSTIIPPSGGTSAPLPAAPNWASGDLFNYTDLPASMQSPMVSTQLTELGYTNYNGPKAVAITANGLGFVRRALPSVTQAQVEKMAVDSCVAISGGQPCGLIAGGNFWKVARANLNNSFTGTLSTPTAISGSMIPFLAPADAANAASVYNAAPQPKALAISLDGAYMWVGQNAQDPIADVAEAKRLVMERCELAAGAIPCTLFAENGSIVFNPSAINRSWAIDYARTAVSVNIPGVKQTPYVNVIQNNYLVNGGAQFGAIYIAADGRAGAFYGSTDSDAQARNYCNSLASNGFACFKYATNASVNAVGPNTTSRVVYGQNMHCKVVPRANCAAHKAIGCPAGQYYTIQAGQPALESCL